MGYYLCPPEGREEPHHGTRIVMTLLAPETTISLLITFKLARLMRVTYITDQNVFLICQRQPYQLSISIAEAAEGMCLVRFTAMRDNSPEVDNSAAITHAVKGASACL
jgi:hypothetical protein